MKKTIIIIAALLGFALAASAQPKAIGLRSGLLNYEVSYAHYLDNPHFFEFDLGMSYSTSSGKILGAGFDLTATYNWVFAQPDWTPQGTWAFYAGPGVALGSYYYTKRNDDGSSVDKSSMYLGVVGQVGLEYTFWFPLQLSVDIRPSLHFGANGANLNFPYIPCFSARYHF